MVDGMLFLRAHLDRVDTLLPQCPSGPQQLSALQKLSVGSMVSCFHLESICLRFQELKPEDLDILQPLPGDESLMTDGPFAGHRFVELPTHLETEASHARGFEQ